MPDITMCKSSKCGKRHECYRYRTMPSRWQSWAVFWQDREGDCRWFMPLKDEDQLRSVEDVDKEVNDT